MALIICTECGIEYSDKAGNCPKCACPTHFNLEKATKPIENQDEHYNPDENYDFNEGYINTSESIEEEQKEKEKTINYKKRALILYLLSFIIIIMSNSNAFISSKYITYHDVIGSYSLTYDLTFFLATFVFVSPPVIIIWLVRKFRYKISKNASFLMYLHSILFILYELLVYSMKIISYNVLN